MQATKYVVLTTEEIATSIRDLLKYFVYDTGECIDTFIAGRIVFIL